MMRQRIGLPPISTVGFGRLSVSSASRVPIRPARMPSVSPCGGLRRPIRACQGHHIQIRAAVLLGEIRTPSEIKPPVVPGVPARCIGISSSSGLRAANLGWGLRAGTLVTTMNDRQGRRSHWVDAIQITTART